MKVIYSFNSFAGKTTPGYWYLRMAELSVQSMKNCGYKVELYVDAESADFFRGDLFCVPFDTVHIVDFMQFPHNFSYWNFGKLYVYSLQNEPFLHVDFDTYFKPGFKIPENCAIVTEQLREYSYVKPFQHCAILQKQKQIPEKLICSGLLGGKAYFAFKELFEFACEYCKNPPATHETMGYLVGVEEFNLSQLAHLYQLPVVELPRDEFLHWQGENKREVYGDIIKDLYRKTFGKPMYYGADDKKHYNHLTINN